MLSFAQNLRTN